MGHPCWRYRSGKKEGEFESKLFDSDEVPEGEGWIDSPARIGEQEAPKKAPKEEGFDLLKKAELIVYAKDNHGVDICPSTLVKDIKAQIKTLEEAKGDNA